MKARIETIDNKNQYKIGFDVYSDISEDPLHTLKKFKQAVRKEKENNIARYLTDKNLERSLITEDLENFQSDYYPTFTNETNQLVDQFILYKKLCYR